MKGMKHPGGDYTGGSLEHHPIFGYELDRYL